VKKVRRRRDCVDKSAIANHLRRPASHACWLQDKLTIRPKVIEARGEMVRRGPGREKGRQSYAAQEESAIVGGCGSRPGKGGGGGEVAVGKSARSEFCQEKLFCFGPRPPCNVQAGEDAASGPPSPCGSPSPTTPLVRGWESGSNRAFSIYKIPGYDANEKTKRR